MQAAEQAQNLRLSTMQEMLSLLPRAKAASVSFLAAFSGSCTYQQTWCILAIPKERTSFLRQHNSPQALAQPTCRKSYQAHACLPHAPGRRFPLPEALHPHRDGVLSGPQ